MSFTLITFILLLGLDFLSVYWILTSTNQGQLMVLNKLVVICNSVVIAFLLLTHCSQLFILQKNEGLWKIDLNFGYSGKNIFLSRVLLSYFLSLVLIVSKLIVDLIIYFSINKYDSLWAYSFIIAPFGWYSIFAFFIPIIVLVFSVLIKSNLSMITSTLFAIFILLLPAFSIFSVLAASSNDFNKQQAFADALKNQYLYSIKKQIDADEFSTIIYNEAQERYKYAFEKERFIMSGYDNKQAEDSQYWNFINDIEQQIDVSQANLISWTEIQEWSNKTVAIKETPGKILDKVNFSIDSKYKKILTIYQDFATNWNIWRDISQDNPVNGVITNSINKMTVKSQTTATKFLFRKSFESMLFDVCEAMEVIPEPTNKNVIGVNPVVVLQEQQNSYLFANLLNPITHFNLMFNSINYKKNNGLIDYYNYNSMFYNKSYNSKVIGKKGQMYLVEQIKPLLNVSFVYLFYFAIGCLVIFLIYPKWQKNLKK
ncbi:hypothetical protein [Mesoplasma seiffertii]|uniref:hypothetical protein n=1 Tax=Mesoplasma seiffertii TaxID=28224 RepID=UPI0012EC4FA2|nr:hypothetical protein [Mesoplasma seiffertii]